MNLRRHWPWLLTIPGAALCAFALRGSAGARDNISTQTLAPGLSLTTMEANRPAGPLRMYVVRAAFGRGWRWRVAPAGEAILRRETVSTIAARTKAPVAVNGGYFAYEGAAIGPLKIDGQWLRLPWKNRTTLGIDAAGKIKIDNLRATAHADFGALSVPVSGFNAFPTPNSVTILTPRFASTYKLKPGELALEIEKGAVAAQTLSGTARIRPSGWTLIAGGAARALVETIHAGTTATFAIDPLPAAWNNYPTILGAGPRLLRGGRIETTEIEEEFKPDVIRRGPRTAAGVDKDGNYIIVVVDGWQAPFAGLTIPELAQEMQTLGVIDALNLDGGASTALVVNNRLIGRPSAGREVTVANALLVAKEQMGRN